MICEVIFFLDMLAWLTRPYSDDISVAIKLSK